MDKELPIHQYVRSKSLYTGASEIIETKEIILEDGKIIEKKISHCPKRFQIYAEYITNATDQIIRTKGLTNFISIRFLFNRFHVYNNGPGIEVWKDGDKWNPELLCTNITRGSNHEGEKILGGCNGIGMKLGTYMCEELKLKTKDYEQLFECKCESEEDEVITHEPSLVSNDFQGTSISIKIHDEWAPKYDYLESHIEALISILNIYVNQFYDSCILFNFNMLNPNIEAVFGVEFINPSCSFDYPLKIFISRKNIDISVINGIVWEKGDHVNMIKDKINQKLKPDIEKYLKTLYKGRKIIYKKNIHLFDRISIIAFGQIPNIQTDSQIKKNLQKNLSDFTFDIEVKEIFKLLKVELQNYKLINSSQKVKTLKCQPDLYKRPLKMNKDSCLFVVEGQSALNFVIQCVDTTKHGVLALRGVPVNAYKEAEIKEIGGQKYWDLKDKFSKSTFVGLMTVLGLKIGVEKSTPKFKNLIVATDQDKDGLGQIFSLISVGIYRFWPKLFKKGFVQRWATPIIKVDVKRKNDYINESLEFFYESDYEDWVNNLCEFSIEETKNIIQKYCSVHYYKGLSSNEEERQEAISSNLWDNIYTYTSNDKTEEVCDLIYNPKRTNDRKKWLSGPVPNYCRDKTILLQDHLLAECMEFHLHKTLDRAMSSAIDGLCKSRRKILFTAIKYLKKTMTVEAFGGLVKANMNYHHGAKSLNSSIIKMAQNFANQVPLLEGRANLGSERTGPDMAVAPRYAMVNINRSLICKIYPLDDMPDLDYVYEDGEKSEPKYLIPIICMSIVESKKCPGTGWATDIFGRKVKKVKELTLARLNGTEEFSLWGKHCGTNPSYDGKTELDHCIKKNGYIIKFPQGIYAEPYLRKTKIPYKDYSTKKKIKVKTEDDPIKIMNSNISLVYNDRVKVYDNYNQVFDDWFEVRKKAYKLRVKRKQLIVDLKRDYYNEIIRFIRSGIKPNDYNRDEFEELVSDYKGFTGLFDLAKVKYKDIKLKVLTNDHDYLWKLKFSNLSKGGEEKFIKKRDSLKDEVGWKETWITELNNLNCSKYFFQIYF